MAGPVGRDHSAQIGCGLDTQPAGSRQNELSDAEHIIFFHTIIQNAVE